MLALHPSQHQLHGVDFGACRQMCGAERVGSCHQPWAGAAGAGQGAGGGRAPSPAAFCSPLQDLRFQFTMAISR